MAYKLITNEHELNEVISMMLREPEYIVFDTETNTLNPYRDHEAMIGISVWLPSRDFGFYAPFRHGYKPGSENPDDIVKGETPNLNPSLIALLRPALTRQDVTYIGYNTKFDWHVLWCEGIPPAPSGEDVMTAAVLVNENEPMLGNGYGLKTLSRIYLKDKTEGEEALYDALQKLGYGSKDRKSPKFWKANMWRLSADQTAQYAIDDVRLTWELRQFYMPIMGRWGQLDLYKERNDYYRRVLWRMEKNGTLINPKVVEDLQTHAKEQAAELHASIVEMARQYGMVPDIEERAYHGALAFNPNSSKQVGDLLAVEGFALQNTQTATLETLDHPTARLILEWKATWKAALADLDHDLFKKALGIQANLSKRALQLGVVEPVNISEEKMKRLFNPGSHVALKKLFTAMGTPVASTQKATLEVLAANGNRLAQLVLDWRIQFKANSTYYEPWLRFVDGENKLHMSMFAKTVTGRVVGSEPNLFQIPREGRYNVKAALVAPKGYKLVQIDYTSQELYLAAAFSRCPNMIEQINLGTDLHWYTTEQMDVRSILYGDADDHAVLRRMGVPEADIEGLSDEDVQRLIKKNLRQVGKILNFSILYGAGVNSVSKTLNIKQGEAKRLLEAWWSVYPEMSDLNKRLQHLASSDRNQAGEFVRKGFHYHRNPDNHIRHFDAYKHVGESIPLHVVLNVLVQGYGATIIRQASLAICDEFPEDDVVIPFLTLYDALYFYVKEGKLDEVMPRLIFHMTNFDLEPRLKVDPEYGDTMLEANKWKVS